MAHQPYCKYCRGDWTASGRTPDKKKKQDRAALADDDGKTTATDPVLEAIRAALAADSLDAAMAKLAEAKQHKEAAEPVEGDATGEVAGTGRLSVFDRKKVQGEICKLTTSTDGLRTKIAKLEATLAAEKDRHDQEMLALHTAQQRLKEDIEMERAEEAEQAAPPEPVVREEDLVDPKHKEELKAFLHEIAQAEALLAAKESKMATFQKLAKPPRPDVDAEMESPAKKAHTATEATAVSPPGSPDPGSSPEGSGDAGMEEDEEAVRTRRKVQLEREAKDKIKAGLVRTQGKPPKPQAKKKGKGKK